MTLSGLNFRTEAATAYFPSVTTLKRTYYSRAILNLTFPIERDRTFTSRFRTGRDGQFRLSELMNSVMYFFPRTYVPAIRKGGERVVVTLPTGEEIEFDSKTNEIVGGVFSEEPVDLNPDKHARKFPGII